MKLIQKLKIWKELRRLEGRVHQTPSPSTFVDLGQVYINLGMHDRTLELAEEGLLLFPRSNELRKLRKFAKKNQLSGRIAELRQQLAQKPSPETYDRLAALYVELGDAESVQGVCEECVRRFPNHPSAWLLLGQSWLTAFYRDLRSREGIEAVRALERAIELDPEEARGRRLLAEVLYRVGADRRAAEQLDLLVRSGVVDDDVHTMRKAVAAGQGSKETLESLLHEVEARGSLARPPLLRDRGTAPGGGEDELYGVRTALTEIAELGGVRKAVYIRGAKALVKGEIRDAQDTFLRVARVVARAAQRAARRMDIGNFSKGVVDGDFGHICLCSFGEAMAAVQCDAGGDVERLLDALQEMVADSLFAAGGRST